MRSENFKLSVNDETRGGVTTGNRTNLDMKTQGVTQLSNTIMVICIDHEDKNIELIDEHYLRLISSI